MKRKKKKALILSVFMILLLAACSSRTNVRDGDDYIYCLNPDKTGLGSMAARETDATGYRAGK